MTKDKLILYVVIKKIWMDIEMIIYYYCLIRSSILYMYKSKMTIICTRSNISDISNVNIY